MVKEMFSCGCEGRPAAGAVEEPAAYLLFQGLNRVADCGLADTCGDGGLGKTQVPGKEPEDLELP